MLLRLFKKTKKIRLGRWDTNVSLQTLQRKIDLANCDSCGTCTIALQPKKKTEEKLDVYVIADLSTFHTT